MPISRYRPRLPTRRRLRPLAIAVCSLASAFDYAYAADSTESEAAHLPAIEIRSKRSHYDPRPASVSTATKTDSDPKDVPQAVNSVSVEQVSSYGGRDLASALSGVPGVSNVSDTRFDAFRIRGFTAAGDVLLDGMRDDAQYVRSLGNIERVEVLKGPAAVLYGRGSGGGVINQISKKPGHDAPSAIDITAGSQGRLGFAADISRVLSDDLTMRINTGRERMDSFRNNVDSTRQYFAPSIKWESGPTSWLVQGEYAEFERVPDRGMPGRVSALNSKNQPTAYRLPPAPHETFYGDARRDFIRDVNLNLRSTFVHELSGGWEVRNMTSLLDLRSKFDNTFVTLGYVDAPRNYDRVTRSRFQQDLRQRNFQNNLELSGRLSTGPLQHHLLLGSEYSRQTRDPRLLSAAAAQVSLNAARNPSGVEGRLSPFSMNYHKATGYALYAQDQIDLSTQWKVLAGLRWDRFGVDSNDQLKKVRIQRSSSVWSPRLGIVWSPLVDHSFYASYSKNFAPVGGDTIGLMPTATGNANNLGPQFSRQYEVGVKSDWFEKKISTTLSVYQLELYNRSVSDPLRPGTFYLTGQERSRGVELGMNGQLATNWFIRSGFNVQNAKIVQAEAQFQGKRSAGVSAKSASAFVSYAPSQGLFAEAGLVYEGARYADRDNLLMLPGYTRWDAKAGYRFPKVELTAAVTNVMDRRYDVSATGASQVIPGSPRALVVNAAYKF